MEDSKYLDNKLKKLEKELIIYKMMLNDNKIKNKEWILHDYNITKDIYLFYKRINDMPTLS